MSRDYKKEAVAVFDAAAEAYQTRYADVSMYAQGFDFVIHELAEDASVFEVACGPGNVARYFLDRSPKLNYTATDLAPNMLKLCAENVPEARLYSFDCTQLPVLSEKFNALICGFAFPYLSKEECIQFIADARFALCENGLLYISTMQGLYSDSKLQKSSTGEYELFIRYHERAYLKAALEANGFTLVFEETVDSPDGSGGKDMVLVGKLLV